MRASSNRSPAPPSTALTHRGAGNTSAEATSTTPMKARLTSLLLAFLLPWSALHAADRLQVDSAFEGGSVAALEVDDATRTIRFSPGGDPQGGALRPVMLVPLRR